MQMFKIDFKCVEFDVDPDDGGETVAAWLNTKYGKSSFNVQAKNENDALHEALELLTEKAGYCVLDADYDVNVCANNL